MRNRIIGRTPGNAWESRAEPDERAKLEQRIRTLCEAGDVGHAVEAALTGYGPEIMRMISSLMKDPEQARDVFAAFSEALLLDLSGFRWESSFRTWAFQIARHACYRHHRSAASREEPVTHRKLERSARERSRTHPWLRSDVKSRFRQLRGRLDPQEQLVLTLRIDRGLPWPEVVRALAAPGEELTAEQLGRRAAVLRQQFQRTKARLRQLAREAALVSRESLGA